MVGKAYCTYAQLHILGCLRAISYRVRFVSCGPAEVGTCSWEEPSAECGILEKDVRRCGTSSSFERAHVSTANSLFAIVKVEDGI